MRNRRSVLLASFAATAIAGCDTARYTPAGTSAACTTCHGGVDNTTASAPFFDTHGSTSSAAAGQHTAHLAAGVQCGWCHVVPASIGAPGHMDDDVTVPFPSVIGQNGEEENKARFGNLSPSWDPVSHTCAVYCHGASLGTAGGGSLTTPDWSTPFPAGNQCGFCHGFPPPGPHPTLTSPTVDTCKACHPDPTTGTTHIDGVPEVVGGHAAGYADPASTSFHGPDAIAFLEGSGTLQCSTCHGPALDGVGGTGAPSCGGCHSNPAGSLDQATLSHLNPAFQSGVANWKTNCTFCHGTATEPFDYATQLVNAGPPESVGGQTAATDPHVGAHPKHLVGGSRSGPFPCASCHVVPVQDTTSLDHLIGGNASPTFPTGSLASAGNVTPTYTKAGQTCTTYCHGASLNGGSGTSPAWTTSNLACDACHGLPPDTGQHVYHVVQQGFPCYACHQQVATSTSPPAINATNKGLHVNGVPDVKLLAGTYTPPSGGSSPTCSNVTGCHTSTRSW